MIKNLDGSMVNVRLIESDTSFWAYSGDPIFIENEQFISANLKIKFDSAPMDFLRQCSASEVEYPSHLFQALEHLISDLMPGF